MSKVLTNYEAMKLRGIPIKIRDILWDEILKKKYGEIRSTCSLPKDEYLNCVRWIIEQFYFDREKFDREKS